MGKNFFSKYLIIVILFYTELSKAQSIDEGVLFTKEEIDNDFINNTAHQIKDYSIVMLGEPTHGEGNILKLKTELVKVLIEKHGFSIIAFESGLYDLWKANQNILKGEDYIQSVKEGIFNVWSCSEQMSTMFNILEQCKQKIKVTGFDMQFSGEYAIDGILDDLILVLNKSKIEINFDDLNFWASTCEVMAEKFIVPKNFDIGRFNKISNQLISTLSESRKEEDILFWIQILKSTKALANDYYYNAPSLINKEEWKAKNSNARDKQMANNLLFLKALYPGKKIICWGASTHFAKGFNYANNNELNEYIPMGKIVVDSLKNSEVISIAFTGSVGNYGISEPYISIPLAHKSLEDSLNKIGYSFAFIKLSKYQNLFYAKPIEYVNIYNLWSTTFDAIFYSKVIEPNKINCSYRSPTNYFSSDSTTVTSANISNTRKFEDKNEYLKSIYSKKKYTGKLMDKKTGEPLSYAHISYLGSNLGTVADENGNFSLFESLNRDSIQITSIGYKKLIISKKSISTFKSTQIFLDAEVIALNEVTVKGERLDAKSILEKVLLNFDKNYLQTKYSSVVRVSQISKGKSSSKFQIVTNIISKVDNNGYTFFSPYPGGNEIETQLVESSTLLIDSLSMDTISVEKDSKRIVAATAFIDLLNYRKNSFLNPGKWRTYQFELVEILNNEFELNYDVYRILFKSIKPKHFNTLQLAPKEYWGEIFVSSKDFAIIKFLTFTNQDKDGIWRSEHLSAYKTEPNWFNKTVVTYKSLNGKYFMDRCMYLSNWDVANSLIEIESLKIEY